MAIPATLVTLFLSLSVFNLPSNADYVLFSDSDKQSHNELSREQNLTFDMTIRGQPYGPHVLSLQPNCQLVLYNYGEPVWSTLAFTRAGGCKLTLLSNGQLSLHGNPPHRYHPLWASCAGRLGGPYALVVQRDGWIGVFGPELWSNKISVIKTSPIVGAADQHVLYSYQTMPAGIILMYKNFRLVLRDNCNLVLEDMDHDFKTIWQTNTVRSDRDCFLMLDSLGELSIKTGRGHKVWSSGTKTSRPGVYILVLRYDARLVIFEPPIWTSFATFCPLIAAAGDETEGGVELLSS